MSASDELPGLHGTDGDRSNEGRRPRVLPRVVGVVLVVAALAVLAVLLRDVVSADELAAHEVRLRERIEDRPLASFAIGLAVYVVVSLVPGTTGKALIAGWLFGFVRGLLIVNVGLTIAALVSFAISRGLLRDLVLAKAGPRVARVNDVLEREGAGYLFVARILHAPYSITNYVMGATRIRWTSFWWATQLGLLPGNLLYVYAGAQAPSIAEIVREGPRSIVTPGLLIAFVLVSTVPLLLRWLARWMVARARARRAASIAGAQHPPPE